MPRARGGARAGGSPQKKNSPSPSKTKAQESLGRVGSAKKTECDGEIEFDEDGKEKPRVRVRDLPADEKFTRVLQVKGKVISAKGLPKTDGGPFGKADPYCVVKGIRANNHLVDMFVTRAIFRTLTPQWNQEFTFECPASWGVVDLVGLKFLIYDTDDGRVSFMGSDDFLGGADVDISEAREAFVVKHELEAAGALIKKIKNTKGTPFRKAKKPRLSVEIAVFRTIAPKPLAPAASLRASLNTFTRVAKIYGRVVKAANLRNADLLGKSDPQCVVRAVMFTGEVHEIYRTSAIDDSLNPIWNEEFTFTYRYGDEPVLLCFDIFDVDDGEEDVMLSGDHLGSAFVHLKALKSHEKKSLTLNLKGSSQLFESFLERDGTQLTVAEGRRKRSLKEATTMAANAGKEEEAGPGFLQRLRQRFETLGKAMKREKTVRSTLGVELMCDWVVEPMPLAKLVTRPMNIRDEEDVKEAVRPELWERSAYKVPAALEKIHTSGDAWRVPHSLLSGFERIEFISGVVHGATGLANTDAYGKSDPYCVVEGLSVTGERLFIHRTAVMQDSLCPMWQESFFSVVPHSFTLHRLLVSVFDSDDVEGLAALSGAVTADGEDDFLGRATVDLTYLRAGDRIHEDFPLVGSKAKRDDQKKATSGFRRNAMISCEVRCERRVLPHYEIHPEDVDSKPSVHHEHKLSRMDPSQGGRESLYYQDPSQDEGEEFDAIPGQVLMLHETKQLLAVAQRRPKKATATDAWLKPQASPTRGHPMPPAALTAGAPGEPPPTLPGEIPESGATTRPGTAATTRPGTAASAGRPGTAVSRTSMSRPGTAASVASIRRPGTAASVASGISGRPGTAASLVSISRPGATPSSPEAAPYSRATSPDGLEQIDDFEDMASDEDQDPQDFSSVNRTGMPTERTRSLPCLSTPLLRNRMAHIEAESFSTTAQSFCGQGAWGEVQKGGSLMQKLMGRPRPDEVQQIKV
mmetsp:Transcript_93180/g.199894  ORF Transcript_93180/g.199894 Transcript_93180/m.199894 type:complete len:973 (-) Transcript_93180:44-2962(-)